MRLLGPSCYFHVQTPRAASTYLEGVIATIVAMLESEKAGAITRSSSIIAFDRRYTMTRYSTNRLALFNPGSISIRAKQNEIVVDYHLGISPLYVPFGAAFLCLLFLYFIPSARSIIGQVCITSLIIMLLCLFIVVYRAHIWLKSGVLSAVHNHENGCDN
jgi:hypothetical protein